MYTARFALGVGKARYPNQTTTLADLWSAVLPGVPPAAEVNPLTGVRPSVRARMHA